MVWYVSHDPYLNWLFHGEWWKMIFWFCSCFCIYDMGLIQGWRLIAKGKELSKVSVLSKAELSFQGLTLTQFCGFSLRKKYKIRNRSKHFKWDKKAQQFTHFKEVTHTINITEAIKIIWTPWHASVISPQILLHTLWSFLHVTIIWQ